MKEKNDTETLNNKQKSNNIIENEDESFLEEDEAELEDKLKLKELPEDV